MEPTGEPIKEAKRCNLCNIVKYYDEFYVNFKKCKECMKAKNKEYYNNNKDKFYKPTGRPRGRPQKNFRKEQEE